MLNRGSATASVRGWPQFAERNRKTSAFLWFAGSRSGPRSPGTEDVDVFDVKADVLDLLAGWVVLL